VKQLLEAMNGTIGVESEEGKGSNIPLLSFAFVIFSLFLFLKNGKYLSGKDY